MTAVHRYFMASSLALILAAGVAHPATISVRHVGQGNGVVKGGTINCGAACTGELAAGESVTLTYTPDATAAELMGWGGACTPYEARPSCTVTANDLMTAIYGSAIPVVFGTGYYRDGVCRAVIAGGNYQYYADLQTAYNTVIGGTAFPPIECVADKQLSIGTITGPLEISGGWGSFAPNASPAEGATSTITGTVVIGAGGSMTITGIGGITLACGYRTVTGPYTVTEPLIIGATPCDFGLIVQ